MASSRTRKKLFSKKEVLRAILESDSDYDMVDSCDEVGIGNDSDNDDPEIQLATSVLSASADDDEESRALQDADMDDESDTSDDSAEPWTCPDFSWKPANNQLPLIHPFSGNPGINVDVAGFTAIDFYQLFLSPELLNHFVIQTNLQAEHYFRDHPHVGQHSRVRSWKETNCQEMRKFIGIIMLMGIVRKPSIDMYWSTDPLYATPLFSAVMPRDRFTLILKFFHVNDNEPKKDDPTRDRLYKIRPLLDHLFEIFQTVYTPGPSVAVDESLLLWKGRLQFKQYLPLKRARFGVKLFCIAEDSGYLYRFRVYTGKDDPQTAISSVLPQECANFGVTEKIVVFLALPLLDQGYTIFMDNWYSSCRLYDYLHHRQTMACGTIRSSQAPLVVRQSTVAVGNVVAFRSDAVLCLKFRDKKDIFMITTQHDGSMQTCPRRRGRPSLRGPAEKPECIVDYNANMGAVDKQDQMLELYSAARKTMKWYRKLTFHLLQRAMLNAHIVFQKNGGSRTFLQFQHDVVAELIFADDDTHDDRVESVVRLTERHFPQQLQPTATWTKPQARCRVCSKRGTRRDVKTYCSKCPSKPRLCAVGCFEQWHTKLKYWE